MADPKSNALLRAGTGLPTSGVIHVRTRLTADFTVLSNALARRRGSAVTVGVAAYIASLPDGTPVTIAALCDHFSEGEILISRALRDLEAAGFLERRRERQPPGSPHPDVLLRRPRRRHGPQRAAASAHGPGRATAATASAEATATTACAEADEASAAAAAFPAPQASRRRAPDAHH